MRKVFSVLVLAAVVLFTANCGGGNTPASIEKSMLTQIQKGNYDGAIKVMMDNLDATKEQKGQMAAFVTSDKLKQEFEKDGNALKSFEIVSEEISEDGKSAVVTTKMISADGKEDTKTSKYVNKDGKWLMAMDK